MPSSTTQRKTRQFQIYCSPAEKRYIQIRAREAGMSASLFLRELGLKDSLARRKRLPPEVFAFNGQLAGISGALEIIARKRLDNEDLNGLERAELQLLAKELKLVAGKIKSYLI